MAIIASIQDRFGGNIKVIPEALRHMSLAHRLLNERLSGPEAICDGTIAVVTLLTIYHIMHHQRRNAPVHFKGLCRMIQLRGGLAKLAEQNPALAQKPWRLDIEFAIQNVFAITPTTSINNDLYRGVSKAILTFLVDTTYFTNHLNTVHESTKLAPEDYATSVFRHLHLLLHFAPLGHARPMKPLENLVHLSLVAVMTTLMPEYGYNQAKYDLLSGHLRLALQTYVVAVDRNNKLFLWALSVGYATILDASDHVWLAQVITKMLGRRRPELSAYVRSVLNQYPWISVFYDKSAVKLWGIIGKTADIDAMSVVAFRE